MSRITKCICDGCGREIEKDPICVFAEKVDIETRDYTSEFGFWAPEADYCGSCFNQIKGFVEGLPVRNAGKPAVANPEFERVLKTEKVFEDAKSFETTAKPVRQGEEDAPKEEATPPPLKHDQGQKYRQKSP